jgi:hypothetical protein
MNGPRTEKVVHHQAEARWSQRRCHGRTALPFEQPCLYDPLGQGCKTAVGHCHAVQHPQQRRLVGILAPHEREAGLDFSRRFGQGQGGTARPRPDCADRSGASTKQSKLVWPHLVGARHHRRVGNICSGLAEGSLCTLETQTRPTAKAETSTAEKHIVLSVERING